MLHYHSVVIFVNDVERSKDFYENTLDQQLEFDFGKNVGFTSGITLWEITTGHVIPDSLKDKVKAPGNRFELYFETEDIQDTFAKLKERGVEFMHEIHEEPWGQFSARFFDPDGHLLEVGETLDTFVKRIYEETGSVKETSKRTTIPEEMLKQIIENF